MITTSASIPNWNYYRFQALIESAKEKLRKVGIKKGISDYQIALCCLNKAMPIINRKKIQRKRAVQYNDDVYSYKKIGLIIENKNFYNLYTAKRSYLRASVSMMLDIAIRLYLHNVLHDFIQFVLQGKNKKIQKKWELLSSRFCNYKAKGIFCDTKGINFGENCLYLIDTT